jgi:PTH1 family peptidyl-tRNA hydrolase
VRLIVGLGNPGRQYRLSRHNAGFLILDQLSAERDIPINQTLFDAHIGKGKIDGEGVILAKPQTFMNLSGIAVRKLTDYFRIALQDVIVAHDDLDLPFESIRLKAGGGHAGHKGLISLIDHLGGQDFIRVRFGIGKPVRKTMVEGYVLEHFSKEEMDCLSELTTTAAAAVTDVLSIGIQAAMNKHHGKINTNFIEEG